MVDMSEGVTPAAEAAERMAVRWRPLASGQLKSAGSSSGTGNVAALLRRSFHSETEHISIISLLLAYASIGAR